jgi:hypothetical protein
MMGRAERKVKTRPTVGSVKEEKRSTDFKSPLLLQICHRAERSARGCSGDSVSWGSDSVSVPP